MTAPAQALHRRIGEAATVLGLAAYFVALHLLVVDTRWPRATVAVVIVPWTIALASLAVRRLPRAIAVVAVGALCIATWYATGALSGSPERTVLFESVAFNVVLAAVFAYSLGGGGEAVITRLARVARRGDMPPRVVAYTRTITGAWAAFFALCAALSALLYFTVSRDAWSLFANLLYWPLLVVMFLGEYAVRRSVLSDVDHGSIMTSVRTFAESQHKGMR